ncbi:HD domain-containing protein [Nitrosophilus kaiyonis]|uniref:[protein-PII] uridylyltransferase family protein n=1 Tax=Nitrosophilus kaiyonis TaxID=2930200 RepID=UPI002492E149|nr:HD domain-containing protein [Nitrosophilus kaiyonis]
MELKQKIEELLNNNATEFEISKTIKEYIKNYFKTLDELFSKTQGKDFLVKHTKYIDLIITSIYKVAIRKMFGLYVPMSNSIPITLVALGSYGREQMAPYSDIDLMIVYEDIEGYNVKALIEKILYIIWDTKLKLGHRVHKLDELKEVSKKDNTIKTAILESRYICGSKYLWFKIENELNKIRQDNPKEFIFQKIKEADRRREKYPISMEPNIKEGVGSLRDANLLYWIGNVLYGIDSLKNLTGKVFSDDEYKEFRIALEWLFKIRVALHLVAKKKEDRLLLQYIPDVAKRLSIKSKNEKKAQQIVVSRTLQALYIIDSFSQIFLKKMIRKLLFTPKNYSVLKKSRIYKNIYFCDNKLYSSFFIKNIAIKDFLTILNLVEFNDFDPSFIYYSKQVKYSKNLDKKSKILVKKLFFKKNLYPVLELLYKSGLLHIVIPPLKKVMFLPQFDGYHNFPVDIHSIYSIQNLENIKDNFLLKLFNKLSKDEKALLKLATLLHDAGKGRIQDHSEVGAKLLKVFAQKLGFDDELVNIGFTLIKYHTLMTNTAYNEDIYNEKTLFNFTAKLKSPKILDMLYILTYADVNSVGKDIYNSYSANLLFELYSLAKETFEKKEILEESAKRVKKEESLKRNQRFKELPKSLQKRILSIESNLFFIKHKTNEIIDISKYAYNTKKYSYKINNEKYLIIEIIRKVPLNLGYLLGKLSSMDVASMEVFKLFDDLKYFKIEFLEKIDDENIPFIKKIIEDSFDMNKKIKLKKPQIKKEEIKIDCDHSKTYASMFLNTKNQKGLLAFIAALFDQYGIDIATAKVHTIKNRAKDLFLIEKNGNFCNNKENIIKILTDGKS